MALEEIEMKKILLALMLSIPSFASAEIPMSEFCPKIAELASTVMKARQAGVPMRKMMELAESDVTVGIVTGAYGYSAFTVPEVQDKVIQDFEDLWYLKCVKSYNL